MAVPDDFRNYRDRCRVDNVYTTRYSWDIDVLDMRVA
jgi:hypothetical protein